MLAFWFSTQKKNNFSPPDYARHPADDQLELDADLTRGQVRKVDGDHAKTLAESFRTIRPDVLNAMHASVRFVGETVYAVYRVNREQQRRTGVTRFTA